MQRGSKVYKNHKMHLFWLWLNKNWPNELEVNKLIYQHVKSYIWPYKDGGDLKVGYKLKTSVANRKRKEELERNKVSEQDV